MGDTAVEAPPPTDEHDGSVKREDEKSQDEGNKQSAEEASVDDVKAKVDDENGPSENGERSKSHEHKDRHRDKDRDRERDRDRDRDRCVVEVAHSNLYFITEIASVAVRAAATATDVIATVMIDAQGATVVVIVTDAAHHASVAPGMRISLLY